MDKKNEGVIQAAQNGAMIFVTAGLYIVIGASIYQKLENLSVLDSYYYVVVTLSTIGYGDIAPKTSAGKLFTIFFIVFGIAIFSSLISNIVSRSQKRRAEKLAQKNK